jgi:enamine deaminase RidA (YjgF/YER057c/UK114 family)
MMNNLMKICGVLSLVALFPLTAVAGNQNRTTINPTVYGYSQANLVKANSVMVYAAGQVGVSAEGPNDFQSQVDRSFDNLLSVLKASGASAEDVVKITLLIVDHNPEKLAYLGKKRRAVFGDQPPASTLIPVTRLYADGVLFEIDATAVLK